MAGDEQKIFIVCSLEAFAGIAQRIGGDYVVTDYIVPEGMDPHSYSLSPDDVEKAGKADIIVLANSRFLSLEADLKEAIQEMNQSKIFLDFDDYDYYGITILPAPGIEENYHGYWLYPDNAIAIAKAIKNALVMLMPSYVDVFEVNLNEFIREVEALKSEMLNLAEEKGLRQKGVLLAVPATAYIALSFGMIPKAMILKAPGSYASSQEIMNIEEKIKSGEIVLALCPENMRNSKPGQILRDIQSRTSVPIAYVRVFALSGLKDYVSLLAYNLGVIGSLDAQSRVTSDVKELCAYLGIALLFVAMIAIVEAFIIFRMRRSAEEVLYE